MATTTTTTATQTTATPRTSTFNEVNRKQAFDGWIQEVAVEASKQYNDLELYLDDLTEYLRPEMEKMLEGKDRNILFWWSVRVNYNGPWARDVDEDDEEDWFGLPDDEDNEHHAMSVYLHSGSVGLTTSGPMLRKIFVF